MPLSREEAFELWAASSSPWSAWCKPIVFSYLPKSIAPNHRARPPLVATEWKPAADGGTVLVIDLPGVQSVRVGEALVHAGFRPIPLFNAVPGPSRAPDPEIENPRRDDSWTLVDVFPIIRAIGQTSWRLRELLGQLPAHAPPAFLLDANRRLGKASRPGDFDNRSISLPTDFPSATFLQSRGVKRAVVVLDSNGRPATGGQPASDLGHTLLRWQSAGITILSCTLDDNLEGSSAESIEVARPSWYGAIWHNALTMLGLRRNPMGGFGGKLPVPSAG